jgi:hypothetical protein
MSITLTTSAPATYQLQEFVIGSPADFNPTKSSLADAVEPLSLSPSQVFDYDKPFTARPTPDATFAIFVVRFQPNPTGSTTHTIQTDTAITRVVYEPATTRRRTTTPPTAVAPTDTIYVWCSDHDRFPCVYPDCH